MLKKIALFIVFVFAALSLAIFLTIWMGKSELRKQEQAYVDAGGILDPALFAPPPIPDEENAAIAYEPVFAFLRTLSDDEKYTLFSDEYVDDAEFHALLTKCGPTTEALRAAADLPKCRWEINYDDGLLDVLLPHLGDIRDAAKLLKSNILANTAGPQPRTPEVDALIIRDLEAIFKLSIHSAEDPTLIGQLVATALFQMGAFLYEEAFSTHPAPPNEIGKMLVPVDRRAAFRRALHSEIFFSQTTWESMRAGESGILEVELPSYVVSILSWDRAYYLRSMQTAINEAEKPLYEASALPEPPWYALTTKLFIPALDRSELALAISQLRIEMLKTAEQLRAYKQEHGSYPAPGIIAMPIDPTTGKPIQYQIVNNGFTLTGLVDHPKKDEVTWTWEK